MSRTVEFSIFRYKPGHMEPARFESFHLEVDEGTAVLDALERIRLTRDGSLMYRHSCHHSSCGTCACIINGEERLACTTRVLSLGTDRVKLEPLGGFEGIGDLAVRMEAFYHDIEPEWSCLKPLQPLAKAQAEPGPQLLRFEECIECGCCVAACPAKQSHPDFMGPAALAAVHNEILKKKSAADALLRIAAGERGERWCERALACSRVCPTGVYPARHIAELRRKLKKPIV